eukprot:jgi/Tetstr1/456030/TSEL_042806.t1
MVVETAHDLRESMDSLYDQHLAPKWFALAGGLQGMLSPGEDYFGGVLPCLGDYATFQMLTVVEVARPGALEAAGLTGLVDFMTRFARRPRIAAYLASARRMPLTENELKDPAVPWTLEGYKYLQSLRWTDMLAAAAEPQAEPLTEQLKSLSGGSRGGEQAEELMETAAAAAVSSLAVA